MEALEKAAKTRAERTGIKRALKAGELDPLEAMELPVMQRCLARAFLESLPGIGEAKAAKLRTASACRRASAWEGWAIGSVRRSSTI